MCRLTRMMLCLITFSLAQATVPSLSVGSDQSEQWNANIDRVRGAASIETAVGATTAMSWTTSGGSSAYYWALGAVPINPAVETSSVEASAIPSDAAPTVGDTIDVTINIDMSGMLAPDHLPGVIHQLTHMESSYSKLPKQLRDPGRLHRCDQSRKWFY